MSSYQEVFKRYEKKYLLNQKQYDALKEALSLYMNEDSYGKHSINNIYYDTENFELIRASIDKPVYKEKLRLRSYGVPNANSEVFVEIKKKYKGVVYKRRTQLPLHEATAFIESANPEVIKGDISPASAQILQEVQYFLNRYKLTPKVFIAYDRLALFGKEDSNLRITFDSDIRFRETELDLSLGTHGKPLLGPNEYLMEIKIPGVMPLWLSQTLTQLSIYPTSFSKYGNCYKQYLFYNTYTLGGQLYA